MFMNWKYTNQYIKIYEDVPQYGKTGRHYSKVLNHIIKSNNVNSLFDFGCGQNAKIINYLNERFPSIKSRGYDPAIVYNTELVSNIFPHGEKFDILISTDCLEHIPSDELPQCWQLFYELSPKCMFHAISTRKAQKILPDGTNAHKTVESPEWWRNEFARNFPNYYVTVLTEEFLTKEESYVNEKYRIDCAFIFAKKLADC